MDHPRSASTQGLGVRSPALNAVQVSKQDVVRFCSELSVTFRLPQLCVLAPTRELACQIESEADRFGRAAGIRTACCPSAATLSCRAFEARQCMLAKRSWVETSQIFKRRSLERLLLSRRAAPATTRGNFEVPTHPTLARDLLRASRKSVHTFGKECRAIECSCAVRAPARESCDTPLVYRRCCR